MSQQKRRTVLIVVAVGLLLASNLLAIWLAPGWTGIAFNNLVVFLLVAGLAWRWRDRVLGKWILLGLVAGVAELVADWWLVERTGTLVYPPDGPHLWASPVYMPLAWANIVVQLCGIGEWLNRRLPLPRASLALALFGAVNIPIYEHLAHLGRWWWYHHTPMLGGAPYYVILAEALIALPVAWMVRRSAVGGVSAAALLGLAEGGVMLVAVLIAYPVFGPCSGALVQLPCP